MNFNIPVVAIAFNRPDCVRQLMSVIQKIKPEKFFVVSDGARDGRKEEAVLVQQCREFMIPDWECDFTPIYANENMGCRKRIVSGLDEVFSYEESAIILEDDCLPSLSFFSYCRQMLNRFRAVGSFMSISGSRLFPEQRQRDDVVFSKYQNCWGWATWRRAWECNKVTFPVDYLETLKSTFKKQRERYYWKYILESVDSGKINSWAYLWMFSCWQNKGLTVYPPVNLVANIGAGGNATHTRDLPYYMKTKAEELNISELPATFKIEPDVTVDRWIEDHMYSKSIKGRLLWVADRIGLL